MRGTAVEKDHSLALKLDRDSGNLPTGQGPTPWGTQLIEPACVWENAQVKLGGFFGVVIETRGMAQLCSWLAGYQPGGHFRQARLFGTNLPAIRKDAYCMSDRLFRLRLVCENAEDGLCSESAPRSFEVHPFD